MKLNKIIIASLALGFPNNINANNIENFLGIEGEKYTISEKYSNGMVFSEENKGEKISYFVQDFDGDKKIDKIQVLSTIKDEEDKSLEIKFSGMINNGVYIINNMKLSGDSFSNMLEKYAYESMLHSSIQDIEVTITDNLPIYNKNLELGSSTKQVPNNYNPFGIVDFVEMENTIKESQEIIFDDKDWILN